MSFLPQSVLKFLPDSTTLAVFALLGTLLIVKDWVARRSRYRSVRDVPGPKPDSWFYGNLPQLGDCVYDWQAQYGAVYKFKACIGDDRIVIADPRALDYVFKYTYTFPRASKFREFVRLLTDDGISWAEGETHKKQRAVLGPSFSPAQIKGLFPKFNETTHILVERLQATVGTSPQGVEVDLVPWLQRATLDVIGLAAFGVNFDSLSDKQSEIALIFQKLLKEVLGQRSFATRGQPFIQLFPAPLIRYLDYLPTRAMRSLVDFRKAVLNVAIDAVASARTTLENGDEGGRDILSQIVRECYFNGKQKLSQEEVYSQFPSFLLAGEDTTANAIGWALLELAYHPEHQATMRDEINATYAAVHGRGDADLTQADLDKMPFTIAFIKEILRYHPSLPMVPREATEDVMLPLHKPLTTLSGKVINELRIPKGQGILLNVEGYNRLECIWGNDSHEFKPERWLEGNAIKGDVAPAAGVYANLITFGGGAHSCIGWRFSIQEMQIFLIGMIRHFHVSVPPGIKFQREMSLGSIPVIVGDPSREQRLPLMLRRIEV